MPTQSPNESSNLWPLPKFYFQVNFDGLILGFQEVSGLDIETQVIEYREGNSKQFSTIKMPGINKYGNVTCKKGVAVSNINFWDWMNQFKMNTIKRVSIEITLMGEANKPSMVWTLTNAWPTKISSTDLKSDGNEVAIETLEIAHEGLTILNR